MYGNINPPRHCPFGKPHKMHTAAKKGFLEYLDRYPFFYLNEPARYVEEEWEIHVSSNTIHKVLKDHRRSRKKNSRIGLQSNQLRFDWQEFMLDATAEQLVFIDESLFKVQTGWRSMANGPIGSDIRWQDDIRKGDTWSIFPAFCTEGELPINIFQVNFHPV